MKYSKESTHCKICGSKLISEEMEQEPIEVLEIPEDNHQPIKPDPITNYRNEKQKEDLLSIFIGNNADILMNKAWNWSAFLFGALYMIYRKSWKLAIIFLVIFNLLQFVYQYLNFSITTFYTIYLILDLFNGFFFNHIYCKEAQKKIKKLQEKHKDLPEKEFFKILYKKGGTSIFNIVLWIGTSAVLLYLINLFIFLPLRLNKYCKQAICNEDKSVCVYVENGNINAISCK